LANLIEEPRWKFAFENDEQKIEIAFSLRSHPRESIIAGNSLEISFSPVIHKRFEMMLNAIEAQH
jgi:hypothetical protein